MKGEKGTREELPEASRLNIMAGIWLVLSPYIFSFNDTAATWNSIILGALIGGVAAVHWFWATRATWLDWADGILGLWLVVSPFVLMLGGAAGINNIILGVVVILLSIAGIFTESKIGTARPFGI